MRTNKWLKIWAMPWLIGVLTALGLTLALLGEGFWDILSSLLFIFIFGLTLYAIIKNNKKRD